MATSTYLSTYNHQDLCSANNGRHKVYSFQILIFLRQVYVFTSKWNSNFCSFGHKMAQVGYIAKHSKFRISTVEVRVTAKTREEK